MSSCFLIHCGSYVFSFSLPSLEYTSLSPLSQSFCIHIPFHTRVYSPGLMSAKVHLLYILIYTSFFTCLWATPPNCQLFLILWVKNCICPALPLHDHLVCWLEKVLFSIQIITGSKLFWLIPTCFGLNCDFLSAYIEILASDAQNVPAFVNSIISK